MLEQIITKEVISPIFIVIIAILFYSFIKKVVIKMFRASSKFGVHKKSMTIMNLIINIIKYIIILVALLAMLNVWGVDTKALVASLGIAGVVAGLALQDLLKDLLAGFSIIIDDEYDVGDNIKIGTFRGDVIELGLKNTKIRAYSGEVMTISNRNVNEVINYSTHASKCIIDISVAYEADVEEVENVLTQVCEKLSKSTPYLLSDVELLGVQELDDSAVVFRLVADCEPLKDIEFKRAVNRMVKITFDENNVTIPYPQVVVHNE